ncbi:MAG: hypothetical protein WAN11_19405 [Syntrophobacteraceae bacterium]
MEKKEPKGSHPETVPGMREKTSGPEETVSLVTTMIREMPKVNPPVGLLPSVMEAVKQKQSRHGCIFIDGQRHLGPSDSPPLQPRSIRRLSDFQVFSKPVKKCYFL